MSQTNSAEPATRSSLIAPELLAEIGKSQPDFFAFLGYAEALTIDTADLQKRFYERSRALHPDRFARAAVEEREASIQASSILNDGYRTLRDPRKRAEYVLSRHGFDIGEQRTKNVPPELLEEVFELNMALEEMREGDEDARPQLEEAREHFLSLQREIDDGLTAQFTAWDAAHKPETLAEIRGVLNRRRYIENLLRDVDAALDGTGNDAGTKARRPKQSAVVDRTETRGNPDHEIIMDQLLQIEFGDDQNVVVGIDLGTTNSLVAWMDLTGPEVLEGPDDERIVPSVVGYTEAGDFIAGEVARELLLSQPERAVYSVKRLMGRAAQDIEGELRLFPFRLASEQDGVLRLQLGEKTVTPPEVSAQVLKKLKANAEYATGKPVTQAVITVPAYFNDAQRQATRDAGRIAGLEVLRLVNEPTAASLAYGLDKRRDGVIAVYDLGGGTFDISILRLHEGIFEVLATNGDTHLGGDDVDNLLLSIALEDIASEWGEDVSKNHQIVQRLRRAVIRAKEELSFAPAVSITFEFEGKKYERALAREQFEQVISNFVEKTLGPCRQCLKDAGVTPDEIDEVVMVGGSTRIPLVRQAVERLFRAKPHTELNPDEVVALGAAVQAGILTGSVEDKLLLDVTPLSLGIETMGGVVAKLIHRNTTIPASASEQFTTAVDGQRNVLIHVLQGEREMVKDCRSLARFDLKDIDPLPAGLAKIEVKFLIDANGILNVSARDVRTGKEHSVEVKPSYGLTDEQVEAMIEEAFEKAEDDIRERQAREARVEADAILLALEKAKSNAAFDALSNEDRELIDRKHNELLTVYHSDNHEFIRQKIDELNNATMSLAETMMNTAVNTALKGTKI